MLGVCFLREAPERATGGVFAALRLPKPDRLACRSLADDFPGAGVVDLDATSGFGKTENQAVDEHNLMIRREGLGITVRNEIEVFEGEAVFRCQRTAVSGGFIADLGEPCFERGFFLLMVAGVVAGGDGIDQFLQWMG